MTAVLTRRLFGLIVTLAMGVLPVVPAEHVHEVEEHGHVARHVHRHMQEHPVAVDHDADHGAVDDLDDHHASVDHDDDAPARTLTQDYLVQVTMHQDAPAEREAVLVVPPSASVRLAYAGFVERLIHGPPRGPTPTRGPPSLLAS